MLFSLDFFLLLVYNVNNKALKKGSNMYSLHTTSVIKKFIYAVMILLALCSLLSALGFIFADSITFLSAEEISSRLISVSTVLLVVQILIMPLVLIFQITKLSEYIPYFVFSFIAIVLYIFAWCSTPALSVYFAMIF